MKSENNATGCRLSYYFQFLPDRNRLFLFVAGSALIFGIGLSFCLLFLSLPKTYRAGAQVVDMPSDEEVNPLDQGFFRSSDVRPSPLARLRADAAMVSGRENLSAVIDQLNLMKRWGGGNREAALASLSRRLEVRVRPRSRILDLEVTASSPGEAVEIVHAVAAGFVEAKESARTKRRQSVLASIRSQIDRQRDKIQDLESKRARRSGQETMADGKFAVQALERKIQSENGLLALMEQNLRDADANRAAGTSGVEKLESAESVVRTSPAHVWLRLLIFTVVILLAGFAIGLWSGKRSARNSENHLSVLEKTLNTGPPTLVPADAGILITQRPPHGRRAEPFRELRTRVERKYPGELSRLICVVAPERGEGGAEVSANLASVFADAGHTVLLVDADMRQPFLHEVFQASRHPGLSDYLSGEMRLEETVVKAAHPNLWFIPGGPRHADPCRLLSCKRMDDLVDDMKSRFDYIFLHSPAMANCSDATALVGSADETLLVTTRQKHSNDSLTRAKTLIEAAGGSFGGLVLTEAEATSRKHQAVKIDC